MKLAQFNVLVNYDVSCIHKAAKEQGLVIIQHDEFRKVDDVRILIKQASELGCSTLFLICSAEQMTNQAQNALLKLAEEPPKRCFIVLATRLLGALLPTIRSRANILVNRSNEPETVVSDVLRELATKVYDNLDNISYSNLFNILTHVGKEKEKQAEFLQAMLQVWQAKLCESNWDRAIFERSRIIARYAQDVRVSTNLDRHIKTMLQELKELSYK